MGYQIRHIYLQFSFQAFKLSQRSITVISKHVEVPFDVSRSYLREKKGKAYPFKYFMDIWNLFLLQVAYQNFEASTAQKTSITVNKFRRSLLNEDSDGMLSFRSTLPASMRELSYFLRSSQPFYLTLIIGRTNFINRFWLQVKHFLNCMWRLPGEVHAGKIFQKANS